MTLRNILTNHSFKKIFNFIYKNKYKSYSEDQVILLAVSLQRLYDRLLKLKPQQTGLDNLFLFDNVEKGNSVYFFEDFIDLEIVSELDDLSVAQKLFTNNFIFQFRKE